MNKSRTPNQWPFGNSKQESNDISKMLKYLLRYRKGHHRENLRRHRIPNVNLAFFRRVAYFFFSSFSLCWSRDRLLMQWLLYIISPSFATTLISQHMHLNIKYNKHTLSMHRRSLMHSSWRVLLLQKYLRNKLFT